MNGHFTLESGLYNEVTMFMYSNLIKHRNSCLTYQLLLNEPQTRDQIWLQIWCPTLNCDILIPLFRIVKAYHLLQPLGDCLNGITSALAKWMPEHEYFRIMSFKNNVEKMHFNVMENCSDNFAPITTDTSRFRRLLLLLPDRTPHFLSTSADPMCPLSIKKPHTVDHWPQKRYPSSNSNYPPTSTHLLRLRLITPRKGVGVRKDHLLQPLLSCQVLVLTISPGASQLHAWIWILLYSVIPT